MTLTSISSSPSPDLPGSRQVVHARGREAVRVSLSKLYQPATVRIRRGEVQPAVRVLRVRLGQACLDRARFGIDAEIEFAEAPLVRVGRVSSGSVRVAAGRRRRRHQAGDVFVLAGAGRLQLDQAAVDLAVIDRGLLPTDTRAEAPSSTGPDLAQLWWRTFCYAYDAGSETGIGSFVDDLESLVAAATAALFRPDSQAVDTVQAPEPARPETVRRAMEFIAADPQADLSVADIAAAAGTGTRALQLAFRAHLGTTPMGHLRQVRLQRAHDELAVADPDTGATVSEIAGRWGWSSPSRFAAAYRDTHGRLPSRELRGRLRAP